MKKSLFFIYTAMLSLVAFSCQKSSIDTSDVTSSRSVSKTNTDQPIKNLPYYKPKEIIYVELGEHYIIMVDGVNTGYDCMNSGICGMYAVPLGSIIPSGSTIPEEIKFDDNGDLVITFNNSDVRGIVRNQFQMDGEYTIPDELAHELGGEPYTIRRGLYPIERNDVTTAVTFKR